MVLDAGAADADAERPGRYARPSAPFLAQLIATKQQAPQTRQRRRAEPEDAIAVYTAVDTLAPTAGRNRALI